MAKSKEEQIAEVEKVKKMIDAAKRELKENRKPCDQTDSFAVDIIASQPEKNNIKVTNSVDAKLPADEKLSINVSKGGYNEMNEKQNDEIDIGK